MCGGSVGGQGYPTWCRVHNVALATGGGGSGGGGGGGGGGGVGFGIEIVGGSTHLRLTTFQFHHPELQLFKGQLVLFQFVQRRTFHRLCVLGLQQSVVGFQFGFLDLLP